MYKLILVPLDGSQRAEGILPHVKMLATCTGAETLLLQVVPPDSVIIDLHGAPPAINADILELRTQEAEAYLHALSKSLLEQGCPPALALKSAQLLIQLFRWRKGKASGSLQWPATGAPD